MKHRGAGAVLNDQAAGDLVNDLMPEPAPKSMWHTGSRKAWAGISKRGVHNDTAWLSRTPGMW